MELHYQALRGLYFARFAFVVEAVEAFRLPDYKGGTFRGAFGYALRDACAEGIYPRPPLPFDVGGLYEMFWQPRLPHALARRLRTGPTPPPPYIFEPPLTSANQVESGDRLTCHLTLVGAATHLIQPCVRAFEILSERGLGLRQGRCRLLGVYDDDGMLIFNGEDRQFNPGFHSFVGADFLRLECQTQALHLRYQTPTRLKVRAADTDRASGRSRRRLLMPSEDAHFGVLVAQLYRRLFTLTQLYCCDAPMAYPGRASLPDTSAVRLSHANLSWHDWERSSGNQPGTMKLGGFVGETRFEGPVASYGPLFHLGTYLHLGQRTTFGLGKYTLSFDSHG